MKIFLHEFFFLHNVPRYLQIYEYYTSKVFYINNTILIISICHCSKIIFISFSKTIRIHFLKDTCQLFRIKIRFQPFKVSFSLLEVLVQVFQSIWIRIYLKILLRIYERLESVNVRVYLRCTWFHH